MRCASVALQRRCASVAFVFCTLPLNRYCFPHQRRTLLAAKAFALCEIPTTCCMLPAGWLFVVAPSLECCVNLFALLVADIMQTTSHQPSSIRQFVRPAVNQPKAQPSSHSSAHLFLASCNILQVLHRCRF